MSATDADAAEPPRRGAAARTKDQDARTVMRLRLGVGVIGVLLPLALPAGINSSHGRLNARYTPSTITLRRISSARLTTRS